MNASRRRVLYILHCYHNRAGVEEHCRALRQSLRAEFKISVVFPEGGRILLLEEDGEVRAFSADRLGWPVVPYRAPVSEAALAQVIKRTTPDLIHILHFHNWPLSLLDQVASCGVPAILSFHDYFALTPQYTMQGEKKARDTLTAEYSLRVFRTDISAYLKHRRRILAAALGRMNRLVVPSAYLKRELEKVFPYEFGIVEYGIRPFEPPARSERGEALRFGYVGSLLPQKGWTTVREAFPSVRKRFGKTELHFFGGGQGPVTPFDEGMRFHGPYDIEDLPSVFSSVDVAVIPSLFAETYCMVLSEAWLAGRPVAVSDIGALGERVTDGVNGKKFPPGDIEEIAAAMSWFIENEDWRHWELPRPRLLGEMAQEYARLYGSVLSDSRCACV